MPQTFMKQKMVKKTILIICLAFLQPSVSKAYSVLAHEALIDAVWDHYFLPLLKNKYPSLNDSVLKEAHAYAYGGAVAPDMGYYPFGSKLFTNLVHYVRSGDFVTALLNEAQTPTEYAFALGSLCHYYADIFGHRLGVNPAVPLQYPKDKTRFGTVVTYEQDEKAHQRVEFAFDVSQTAKGNFASRSYHDFIGFKVADSLLERAFYKTYQLHLTDVFGNFSRAIGTFRWTVKNFFPSLTKAAWASKRSSIKKQNPTLTAKRFKYKMRKANYNKEFGKEREKPGVISYLLAVLIKIVPKIGPLAPLKFKAPSPEVENLYTRSFDTVQLHFSNALRILNTHTPLLVNKNLDTGIDTKPGDYSLTDETYGELLLNLYDTKRPWQNAALKKNLIRFFSNGVALSGEDNITKQEIRSALDSLKN
jgi:hypothetical protein